ncbi:MAG TPA: ComC/BlpC family leader-containing pheromone/bacteriocin [Kofleriaceae bacterium]|jgi:hypothetical protein|nr:ComC/BlpC family leader-containing pheromone/bacteriocin [Kofleriaceae bacterium]
MSNKDQFQTIDPTALAQVSGGTSTTTATGTSSDQVLTALTGILNSLQSMSQQNNNSGMNPQEMMMFMMVMQERNQQNAVAAASSPWGWGGQQPIVYY